MIRFFHRHEGKAMVLVCLLMFAFMILRLQPWGN